MDQGLFDSPPPMPRPDALTLYLFENPIPPVLVLLALAGVVFAVLNGRGQGRQALLVGGALAGLALAVAALAAIVTTDREAVHANSKRLLDLVSVGDAAAADDLLSDRLRIAITGAADPGPPGASGVSDDKAWALAAIEMFKDRLRMEGASAPARRSHVGSPGLGKTQVRTLVKDAAGPAALAWWELTWRREPDRNWRVDQIELLLLNGQRPDLSGSNPRETYGR